MMVLQVPFLLQMLIMSFTATGTVHTLVLTVHIPAPVAFTMTMLVVRVLILPHRLIMTFTGTRTAGTFVVMGHIPAPVAITAIFIL